MAEEKGFAKGAFVAALLIAAGAGVWFGRCSHQGPAEAKSGESNSAWIPASGSASAAASSSAGSFAAPSAKLEKDPPQHFDTTENPKWTGGIPLREMDREIFKALNDLERFDRTRMPDVFPDRPYKVQFIGSVTTHYVSHVMIDLNRDGKLDERWELKQSDVKRTVMADASGGGQEVGYTLAQGKWQVH